MPPEQMPSPEEIAKITKERTLADAELLKGGAEYRAERLELTPEQIEDAKAELAKQQTQPVEVTPALEATSDGQHKA